MSMKSIGRNGVITDEIREALKEKVASSRTSINSMARHFGVTYVTFKKWLSGATRRCSVSARKKISLFLNSDDSFHNANRFRYSRNETLPDDMLMCMERIGKAYEFCNTDPNNSQNFIGLMDKAAIEAMHSLVYASQKKK